MITVNETEEWFYQLKGSMLLRIVENGQFRDITIGQGQMYLVPGEFDRFTQDSGNLWFNERV